MDERERGEQEREIETERERTLIGIIVVFSLDREIMKKLFTVVYVLVKDEL
jgi:hypothetical protein